MIRSPGFTSWLVDDGSGSSPAPPLGAGGRHVTFSLATRASRARARARSRTRATADASHAEDDPTCPPPVRAVQEEARLVPRPGLKSSFLPSCLPAFLSFRRYALCGAPVAPACIHRQQMAPEDSARLPSNPVTPPEPPRPGYAS